MKKNYNITCWAIVSACYSVKAESEEEALSEAQQMFEHEDLNKLDLNNSGYDIMANI